MTFDSKLEVKYEEDKMWRVPGSVTGTQENPEIITYSYSTLWIEEVYASFFPKNRLVYVSETSRKEHSTFSWEYTSTARK